MKDPKLYTNHSGGAQGADMLWDKLGRKYGVTDHRHYKPRDLQVLESEKRAELEIAVNNAAVALGRPTVEFKGKDLVRRNYLQVDRSSSVYAVGYIVNPGERDFKGFVNHTGKQIVAGGTGWAVEMAIQKGNIVFVFDMITNHWYIWDHSERKFQKCGTPELSYDFAGVGSRVVTLQGQVAIEDVYIETLGPLKK